MPGIGEALAVFWGKVFTCLRRIMYQGGGDIREAAALFFYESGSDVWEPKKMTDAERLVSKLEACYEELRTLVSQDKVTTLLVELGEAAGL